jgi:hypothetical protein
VAKARDHDPFQGEPGPRFRGARRAAKKGLFAFYLAGLLKARDLGLNDLLQHSSPDGDHEIDRKVLKEIVAAKAFPDADTFVNLTDALMELGAPSLLTLLLLLLYIYLEESIAWDKSHRSMSGRVSETRRNGVDRQERTQRSERTHTPRRWNKSSDAEAGGDGSAGEGGFEPPIT